MRRSRHIYGWGKKPLWLKAALTMACACYCCGWLPASKASDVVDRRHADLRIEAQPVAFRSVAVWYDISSDVPIKPEAFETQLVQAVGDAYPRLPQDWLDPRKEPREFNRPIPSCKRGECDSVRISLARSDNGDLEAKVSWHDGSVSSNSHDDQHQAPHIQKCNFPQGVSRVAKECQTEVVEEICERLTEHIGWHMHAPPSADFASLCNANKQRQTIR